MYPGYANKQWEEFAGMAYPLLGAGVPGLSPIVDGDGGLPKANTYGCCFELMAVGTSFAHGWGPLLGAVPRLEG